MRRSIFLTLAIALSALLPKTASAVVNGSCGGNFTNSNQCTLFLAGPYVYVQGEMNTNSNLYVVLADATGTTSLAYCSSGRGSCSTAVGFTVTGGLVDLPIGAPLTCRVFASGGSGSYGCVTSNL